MRSEEEGTSEVRRRGHQRGRRKRAQARSEEEGTWDKSGEKGILVRSNEKEGTWVRSEE